MNTPLLCLDHVTLKLGAATVFGELNFRVNRGENWAIVGHAGAGKTALLQIIAGKFHSSAGTVRHYFYEDYIREHQPDDPHLSFHKLIGFVESKHHFRNRSNTSDFYYQQRYNSSDSEDALTVEEYLSAIRLSSDAGGYWDLSRVLQRLDLEILKTKQLIKLSNGETKRLLIAAALIKNPILLLLDNPLAGLDVQTRAEFNSIIAEVIASGITVLMATSPFEIPACITHVAVLNRGTLVRQTPARDFDILPFDLADEGRLDQEEFRALLNANEMPRYHWIVKMDRVNITYGDKQVLENVDWQIKQGEHWALLGPNGAGKSTLLSLINGDNPQAYANRIVLFDRKRGTGESIWDIKSKTGFVSPELYQYFPTDNNCLQVIESGFYDTMGLFRPSNSKNAAVALRWMKALEIDCYAHVLLKNIPASAQRLCLLARALIKNPALLIFDEPCQGMDIHQQRHFKMLVDTLCQWSNVTLIYVTHYQHEIPGCVDNVLHLDKGRVISK